MDYQRIYDELIMFRKKTIPSGYIERHHIIMRSLGGSDEPSNMVALTAREHYVAHLLLAKINPCTKTLCALWMMQCKSQYQDERPFIKSSRMYEWARKEFIKYVSRSAKSTSKGERNSQYGTRWICNLELQENRKILKTDELPQGWIRGRNKWNKRIGKPKKGYLKQKETKLSTLTKIDALRQKYPYEGSNSLFKQISSKENISVRTLYNYWGRGATVAQILCKDEVAGANPVGSTIFKLR